MEKTKEEAKSGLFPVIDTVNLKMYLQLINRNQSCILDRYSTFDWINGWLSAPGWRTNLIGFTISQQVNHRKAD